MPAKVNNRRLVRAMKAAPQRLAQEVGLAMKQHALAFDAHMKKTRFGQGAGSRLWRTGNLVRSMGSTGPRKGAKSINGLRMRLFIGQGIAGRYARTQEFGATIRPVKGQYLTIPLPDNLTAAGVPRFKSAAALRASRPGQTFIAKSKRGNLIIGLKGGSGRNARVKWLWVLKRKVTLRPLLKFIDTFNGRAMRRDRADRVNAAVRRALKTKKAG